jgi:hypothetical protein
MAAGEYRVYTRSRMDIPDVVVPPDVYPVLQVQSLDNATYMRGCVIDVRGNALRHDSVVLYLNDEVLRVYKTGTFHYSDTLRTVGEYRLAVVAVNAYGEEIRSFSYKVADGETMVEFLSPLSSETAFALGASVDVLLQGTSTDRLVLWHNGYEVASVSGNAYLSHRLAGITDTGMQYLYAEGRAACSDGSAERSFRVVKPQVTLSSSAGLSVAVGSNVTVTASAPMADTITFNYQQGGLSLTKAGGEVRYTIYGVTEGKHVFTASAKGRYYDGASSSTLTLTVGTSGNEALNKNGLYVYPNPVSDGVLHIEGVNGAYRLFDVGGRVVRKGRVMGGGGSDGDSGGGGSDSGGGTSVNIQALPAGVYILRIGGEKIKVIKN